MELRITENEEQIFFVKMDLNIPNGIQMYFDDFVNLTKLTFENIVNDILFYPEDWIFKYSPQLNCIFVSVETKEIIIPNPLDFVKILRNLLCNEDPHFIYSLKAKQNPFIDKEL